MRRETPKLLRVRQHLTDERQISRDERRADRPNGVRGDGRTREDYTRLGASGLRTKAEYLDRIDNVDGVDLPHTDLRWHCRISAHHFPDFCDVLST